MSLPAGFSRATRSNPCPVCGKTRWCMVSEQFVYCTQIESPNHVAAFNAWRHDFDAQASGRRVHRSRYQPHPIDAPALAKRYRRLVDMQRLHSHADSLGVTVDSLRRLGVGWFKEQEAWAFPMVDGSGEAVGIRLRNEEGRKWAVVGGRSGLFVPFRFPKKPPYVLLPEGPTSTAAMLDLGLPAIGRPDCAGGSSELVQMFDATKPLIVILADHDEHGAGRDGAERLARGLRLRKWAVIVIQPPEFGMDPRDWKHAGATREDIESLMGVAV